MKKFLSIFLSICTILTMFTVLPLTVSAKEADLIESAEYEDDFEYVINDDHAGITRYTGDATELDIPSILGGYPVTFIQFNAFWGRDSLHSVTIPNSVTSMGGGVFSGCSSLQSVTISSSMTKISSETFNGCTSLQNVIIPDSIVNIGSYAFYGCSSLQKIDICDSVKTIESGAFKKCTSLSNIIIPTSVTSIGQEAFSDTEWLNNQPDGMIYINSIAYQYKGNCPASLIIENEITSISDRAFDSQVTLQNITIPDSVISIGDHAFYYCTSLQRIILPKAIEKIGDSTFAWCTSLSDITIPNSVTSIGEYAFMNCISIKEINIPNSVKTIKGAAFSRCSSLESIVIPDSVNKMGWGTFNECISLQNVTIGNSITYIDYYTFSSCISLKCITIPASVTNIGEDAFGFYNDDTDNQLKKVDNFIVYGYSGTEAERYANDNDFTFIPLSSHQDKTTEILIEAPEEEDIEITPVNDLSQMNLLLIGEQAVSAYDIKLTKNGEEVQPENYVTIKIPCDNPDAKVYRVENDNSLTDMNAVYKDGYLVFVTDHFSIYVVATPDDEEYLLGDADGDGSVTVLDATTIQKVRASIKVKFLDEKSADVDGDHVVSVIDATYIQKWLAHIDIPYDISKAIE